MVWVYVSMVSAYTDIVGMFRKRCVFRCTFFNAVSDYPLQAGWEKIRLQQEQWGEQRRAPGFSTYNHLQVIKINCYIWLLSVYVVLINCHLSAKFTVMPDGLLKRTHFSFIYPTDVLRAAFWLLAESHYLKWTIRADRQNQHTIGEIWFHCIYVVHLCC